MTERRSHVPSTEYGPYPGPHRYVPLAGDQYGGSEPRAFTGKVRFIGDVHGKRRLYQEAVGDSEFSVQIGDLGVGFGSFPDPSNWIKGRHRFFRGNHDHPERCRAHPRHLESGDHGPFFVVGGGGSIDRPLRVEGETWWEDEEHSTAELLELVDEYMDARPRLMVSHEAPASVVKALFAPRVHTPSRTSQALDSMLRSHRPDTWIFGHWHEARDTCIDQTRFVCLEEGGWIDVEI